MGLILSDDFRVGGLQSRPVSWQNCWYVEGLYTRQVLKYAILMIHYTVST